MINSDMKSTENLPLPLEEPASSKKIAPVCILGSHALLVFPELTI